MIFKIFILFFFIMILLLFFVGLSGVVGNLLIRYGFILCRKVVFVFLDVLGSVFFWFRCMLMVLCMICRLVCRLFFFVCELFNEKLGSVIVVMMLMIKMIMIILISV